VLLRARRCLEMFADRRAPEAAYDSARKPVDTFASAAVADPPTPSSEPAARDVDA
jgi:hypothetical protein